MSRRRTSASRLALTDRSTCLHAPNSEHPSGPQQSTGAFYITAGIACVVRCRLRVNRPSVVNATAGRASRAGSARRAMREVRFQLRVPAVWRGTTGRKRGSNAARAPPAWSSENATLSTEQRQSGERCSQDLHRGRSGRDPAIVALRRPAASSTASATPASAD